MPTLDPAPSWAAWNHAGDELWPCPEESQVNLNEVVGAEWIDDAGRRARDRLRAGESEAVIGHCADELERSWPAGVWTRAYDAKYQHTAGQPITSLSENEARERLRRTGTGSRRS